MKPLVVILSAFLTFFAILPRAKSQSSTPPTTETPPDLRKVVLCAMDATEEQLELDTTRRLDGIDVSIADEPGLTPGVIGGGDSDLSELVTPAVYINNLHYCNRKLNETFSIEKLLGVVVDESFSRLFGHCPYKPVQPCKTNMKYRRADGSCNNLAHPLWGSAKIPLKRYLPPQYEGNGEPRQHAVDKSLLPNARLISTTLNSPIAKPKQQDDTIQNPGSGTNQATTPMMSTLPWRQWRTQTTRKNQKKNTNKIPTLVTSFYTFFGQHLSHDIDHTPTGSGDRGVPVSCCITPNKYKCFNIYISPNDSFFGPLKRECMGFVRSAEGTDLECKEGVRQQINLITSFIDLSPIYGDSEEDKARLVNPETGLLKESFPDMLLVRVHQNKIAREMGCNFFQAGDPKVNEAPALSATNLLFRREHNRIAKVLASMNPRWNGEKIYQETRRIVIAFMQHILYNEYLPATLSNRLMNEHNLRSRPDGYDESYDPTVDASTSNVIATAAMRFGHSMISNDHVFADKNLRVDRSSTLKLRDTFFRPLCYLAREMDVNRGQILTKSEKCDKHFVSTMRNHLFETAQGNGLDIFSLNIQRGRDHGLPSYAQWRTRFYLVSPSDWSKASFPDHRAEDIEQLKLLYASPLDIDLYTGGVSEIPVRGKTVGPLFARIIAYQFDMIKKGDRFWYETGSEPQRFTPEQLSAIKKVSLARLMCDQYNLPFIQRKAFLVRGQGNPRMKCKAIPVVDLTPWKEEPSAGTGI